MMPPEGQAMLMGETILAGLAGLMIAGPTLAVAADGAAWLPPDGPQVAIMGRVDRTSPGRVRIGYPGVTIRLRFTGTQVLARLASNSGNTYVAVIVDGAPPAVVHVAQGMNAYPLAKGLGAGEHVLDLVHRTETWEGILTVAGFRLDSGAKLLDATPWPSRKLLVIGDSMTCGEGVDRGSDCTKTTFAMSNGYDSYGMLLARRLDAQCQLVCFGGRGLIRDWRGRTDVLTAPQFFDLALPEEDGPPPPAWSPEAFVPGVVIVSLGTNDFNLSIGPLPAREQFVPAYVAFVRRLRGLYPEAHVFLTEGAIVNDGDDPAGPHPRTVLNDYIDATIKELADPFVHHPKASHFPGDECNPHPTGEQHRLMAQELEPQIRAVLGW
jgi:lysophospholipase L1-like esterase